MSTVLTTAEEYDQPVRYKLIIKTADESEDAYTFDSFNTNNAPFTLTDINVDLAGSANTGSFGFRIDDSKDRIVKDSIECGAVVVVQAGKTQSQYQNIMTGIIDEIGDDYPAGNQKVFTFGGLGFGVVLNYTILNFVKSANKEDILGAQPVLNDPTFRIDNMAIEAFESRDILPLRNAKTLKERGGFDTSQLADSVKTIVPSANFPYSTASSILESFASSSGTVLWIGPNREVVLRSPSSRHSGITIRQWDRNPITNEPLRTNDPADSTAYYDGGWSSRRFMKVDQGFFNRIYLTINTDEVISQAPGESTTNFTSLSNKDVWQQFLPGSTRLFNIALLLSKEGNGRSHVDDAYNLLGVQGVIVKDDGFNQPSNKIIAKFIIPYDQIDATPTPVYKIDLQYNVSNVEPNALHWIGLFKRGESETDTIRWYHDADFITPSTSTVPRYSGTKSPFTPQPNPTGLNFQEGVATDSQGPVHRFTFFAVAKTTIEVSDPISIRRYTPNRPVEIRVNAPWINDVKTGIRYANTLLQYGAKLKRIFEKKAISIPTNLIFPLQLVNIVYPPAGIMQNTNLMAEVSSVKYAASAFSQRPFGSDTLELTATGYMNHFQPLIEESLIC